MPKDERDVIKEAKEALIKQYGPDAVDKVIAAFQKQMPLDADGKPIPMSIMTEQDIADKNEPVGIITADFLRLFQAEPWKAVKPETHKGFLPEVPINIARS